MKVSVSIDAQKILKKRGLTPDGFAQAFFTEECAKEMDPYVPMQTGTLKNSRIIGQSTITYPGPYAHYMYQDKLYLAPNGSSWAKKGEAKIPTDIDLTYHGAPMRGPFWDKRMWADKGKAIIDRLAKLIGGKPK